MNFLKSLCSIFRPRYHLYDPIYSSLDPETGKEEPLLIDSFYTRAAWKKAKADLERQRRIERSKQNGTFFRIEVEPEILDDVRRFIYNIQDAEIVSTQGCRTEYISPRKRFVRVEYEGIKENGLIRVCIRTITPKPSQESNPSQKSEP